MISKASCQKSWRRELVCNATALHLVSRVVSLSIYLLGVIMEAIKGSIGALFGSAFGICFMLSATLGWAWWMWMAIKLGSFGMFFFGILGPFALIAGVLGLWSFVFGIPTWLLHLVH